MNNRVFLILTLVSSIANPFSIGLYARRWLNTIKGYTAVLGISIYQIRIIIYILIFTICSHGAVFAELPFKILHGDLDRVLTIDFSPDGKILASAGIGNNMLELWDVQTGMRISSLEGHDNTVTSIAFNKDGLLASASEDETIKLWNVNNGKELRRFLGHNGQVSDIDFSPDGKFLVSGANDQLVKVWDVQTGKEIATLEGHNGAIFSVAFNPNGRVVASGSGDGTIRLWDVATKQELAVYEGHEHYVRSVAFSLDGSKLVSGSQDRTVRIWNTPRNEKRNENILVTFDSYVLSVDFSPDGKLILVGILDPGYGNTISVWDAQNLTRIRAFDTKSKFDIAFSPDGTKFATAGSSDGEIIIWESTTNPPKLLSPQNETIPKEKEIALKWSQIHNAVYYEVEVAQDSDFTQIELSPTIVTDEQFPPKLWPKGSYWWRVRTGAFGKIGGWSKSAYFEVVEPPNRCIVKLSPSIRYIDRSFSDKSTVEIKIEDVHELAGFQLELAFEPNIIEVLNLRKIGEIFGEDRTILDPYPMPPPGFSIFNEDGTLLTADIDNVNGLISGVVATKGSPGGVSGDGVLLEIHFKARDSGECELKLQNIILVNSSQEKISNCQIISGKAIVINPYKPWDVNKDGEVNVHDLVIVFQHLGENIIGQVEPNPDVNGDGLVDDADLSLVTSHFGEKYNDVKVTTSPPPPPFTPTSANSQSPPPPPPAPKITMASEDNLPMFQTLSKFNLTILKETYALVNQNANFNPELISLKNTLSFLIQSLESHKLPLKNQLAQNYPNPFNPETWIPYQLAQESYVTITIFDAYGRTIRNIDIGYQPSGFYLSKDEAAYWDGKNSLGETVSSGAYFYSIRAGNFKAVRRMVVVR